MRRNLLARVAGHVVLSLAIGTAVPAQTPTQGIQRVLLISIDGMHAVDLANCIKGVGGSGSGPTCPALAQLAKSGVTYTQASTSKPSDSFPGLAALITGGSPRTTGFYYDVAYDRSLSPPAAQGAGLCPGTIGTVVAFDESIDNDTSKLDGGGGINPTLLPRDPKRGCVPVYPHDYLRVNTVFEVVKASGGYTAWSDKHPSYDYVLGPSGSGVSDLASPEINSKVVPLPSISGCAQIPDPGADLSAWTSSFQNVQCYDSIKVQTVLNWIDGKKSDGSVSAPVPALFGMNFQAVSVGQKLNEKSLSQAGGYLDVAATPSPGLLSEIQFVDTSIGKFVAELKKQGLYNSTLIIISAKHGQSPINPASLVRIPADNPSLKSPSSVLGDALIGNAAEDDVSLIWLTDQSQTAAAAAKLSQNLATIGGGEILYGSNLSLMFDDPSTDSRSPDIVVTPNVGVVYTGGKKKISEHGGFAVPDTNVILLVSAPSIPQTVNTTPVRTTQVSPTILKALGINPKLLQAVQKEGTPVLPGLGLDNPGNALTPNVVVKPVADTLQKQIMLDASASTDPAGLPLTYSWTSLNGSAALVNANTSTPSVQFTSTGQYSFVVTVTNSAGASSVGSVTVNYLGR